METTEAVCTIGDDGLVNPVGFFEKQEHRLRKSKKSIGGKYPPVIGYRIEKIKRLGSPVH